LIQISFSTLELVKKYPLVISRGATASTKNLFVYIDYDGYTGIGELSPATGKDWTAERGQTQLSALFPHGVDTNMAILDVWRQMNEAQIDPPAMAALDMALWDLFGKRCGMPLYKVFGFPQKVVPTSVTIGLNPPEVTRERVPDILATTGAKCLKIKLGSPEGHEHDQAHFLAAKEAAAPFGAAPSGVALRVDANGGWSVETARMMMKWLAGHGVEYVEQPLVEGNEDGLPHIFKDRPLPIFVDESCRFASDVPKVAPFVDGVNLKLMKCGGPTDALRIIATAQAHGLKTMIGCMSESSIGIAAAAALSGVLDYVDLDSHLNLSPDPAFGAQIEDGVVGPSDRPGHGAGLRTTGAG
jgi:muconate cycloisomerase